MQAAKTLFFNYTPLTTLLKSSTAHILVELISAVASRVHEHPKNAFFSPIFLKS